jgi:hypothetical protein
MNGTLEDRLMKAFIALALVGGTFALFYIILVSEIPESWRDVVMLITGALIANLTTVVSYFFGSSEGSKQKDRVQAEMLTRKP